jgi:pilus assembly protein Flp/PilA
LIDGRVPNRWVPPSLSREIVAIKEVSMTMSICNKVIRFIRSEDGPTAVEYAVLLMLIFAVVLTTVQMLGLTTNESFEDSRDKIINAFGGGSD